MEEESFSPPPLVSNDSESEDDDVDNGVRPPSPFVVLGDTWFSSESRENIE